jgi:decaprenylphospho-beta-D-erythro-pentofuranosid-2-ulose 2-reductase
VNTSTILILGARSDIARAVAHRYAAEGWDVMLAARNSSRIEADCKDLRNRYGIEARALEFDATVTESHEAFVQALNPLPEVVLCVFGYLADQQEAEKDWTKAAKTIAVNYTGAASILHHLANAMEARGSGVIAGISSVAGERGRASNYYYGSAKAGLTAFLSGLRGRLKPHGVHVLTIKPGFVATAMTEGLDLPERLVASPERVAKDIHKAIQKRKANLYTPWFWRWIMLVIKWLPEGIFVKMKT